MIVVQLSVAAGDRAWAAANPAKSEHWRVVFKLPAVVVQAGIVISCTTTVFEHEELQKWLSVIVTERINVLLQLGPAVMLTVDPFEGPTIDPFPEMVHVYVAMPAVAVYTFPAASGHTWFAPVMEQIGRE
jgi:hypothetical protein